MSKVFVGNFSFALDEAAITEYFSKVGQVVSCRVMREGPGGRSRGFGFVEFGTEEEAKKAIEELNGSVWEGRSIKVSEDRSSRSSGPAPSSSSGPSSSGGSSSYNRDDSSRSSNSNTGYFRAQPLDIGFRRRKKLDPFEEDESMTIDYKRPKVLAKFMSERGRILPRRMTGLTSAHQRQVAHAIKRAQHIALLPYRG
jgi:small subunit ribosomal protein S18